MTHWIPFFLSGLSFSLVFFVCFGLPWQCTHQSHGQVCSTIWSRVESHLLFTLCWGEKEQMNVSKPQYYPIILFWKIQKRCKNVANVWLKVSLGGQFCLPKEYNCIEERREICCIVYKVMFIQYFNITSDFRGRYLNRILYLHDKCQQQFIDIVLPFIIRVLIVFLIFV